MFTIHLHNLSFYSYHGLYEEEKIVGGNYEVNAEISFNTDEHITRIEQTINYNSVYKIIAEQMAIPTPLLETLIQNMVSKILEAHTKIAAISINVKKLNPPIKDFTGNVGVSYSQQF